MSSLKNILKQALYNSLNIKLLDIGNERFINIEQIQFMMVNKNNKIYMFPITSIVGTSAQTVQVLDSKSITQINVADYVNVESFFIQYKDFVHTINISVDYRNLNIIDILNLMIKQGIITID